MTRNNVFLIIVRKMGGTESLYRQEGVEAPSYSVDRHGGGGGGGHLAPGSYAYVPGVPLRCWHSLILRYTPNFGNSFTYNYIY